MNSIDLGQLVTPMGSGMRRSLAGPPSLPVRHLNRLQPQGGLSRFAQGGMAEISHDDLMHMRPQMTVPDYLMQHFDGGGMARALKRTGSSISPLLGLPFFALGSMGLSAKDAIRDRPSGGSVSDFINGMVDPSRDARTAGYSDEGDDQYMEPSRPHSDYSVARRMGAMLHPSQWSPLPFSDPITSLRAQFKRIQDERDAERASASVMDVPSSLPPVGMGSDTRRYARGGLSMFRGR